MTDGPMSDNDPFLWLEDIDGPRALAWVRAENARSLALLERDPRYSALLAEARAIITAADRSRPRGMACFYFVQTGSCGRLAQQGCLFRLQAGGAPNET